MHRLIKNVALFQKHKTITCVHQLYGYQTTLSTRRNVLETEPAIRSLLFIPGNTPKMLQKMLSLKPDAFIPDLEDSVPLDKKEEARAICSNFINETYAQYFKENDEKVPLLIPRVNYSEEHFEKDIEAMVSPYIYAITVGKTESAKDVYKAIELLEVYEKRNGVMPESIKLIPTIESATALCNAREICSVDSDRVIGIAFGADDYANDMGFTRNTSESVERSLIYPRQVIGVHTRSVGIQSFDTPNVNFRDPAGHAEECVAVKESGFSGKFAIHPNQIDVIHEHFGVTEKEYDEAVRVVEAYQKAASSSRGSLQIEGRMVDQPVLKQFQSVIRRYKRQQS